MKNSQHEKKTIRKIEIKEEKTIHIYYTHI